MPPVDPSALRTPDARRPFASEATVRRIARLAEIEDGAKLVEVGAGEGHVALFFAQELSCRITALDTNDAGLQHFKAQAAKAGVGDRVVGRVAALTNLGLPASSAELIVGLQPWAGRFEALVTELRPALITNGRVCLSYPVRVGRQTDSEQVKAWEARLGEPLRIPRELLGRLEALGFEPEWVETLSDPELAQYYRDAEAQDLPDGEKAQLHEDGARLVQAAGRSSVSFALLMGRRKEPNEKPPASRDRG